jgi:hypothetical protein
VVEVVGIAHPLRADVFPDVDADASASRNDRAHSSQHTSTVLLPIFTSMGLASSSQSQAAQVFAVMIRSRCWIVETPELATHTRKRAAVITGYRDL